MQRMQTKLFKMAFSDLVTSLGGEIINRRHLVKAMQSMVSITVIKHPGIIYSMENELGRGPLIVSFPSPPPQHSAKIK